MRRDARFWGICALIFLLGSGLRFAAGSAVWPWLPERGQSHTVASVLNRDLPAEATQLALNFYQAVDKGRYADAYATALENHWQAGDAPLVDRLTEAEEFVTALQDELGENGMGLNIIAIQAVTHTVVLREELDPVRYPELEALAFLPAGLKLKQIGRIELAGVLLGRCSRWDWSRDALVAQFSDEKWRLLLPGVHEAHGLHSADWFLPRK